MEFTFIDIILLGIVGYLLFTNNELSTRVNKLSSQVKGMNEILNHVAKEMKWPEPPINGELRMLLKEGSDIKAVKAARENLGFSLLEAKQYVDGLKNEEK